jgi:response regulator of citrate/malate metabolism
MSRNASNLAQRGIDQREVHDDDRTGQLLTILQDQDCREIMAETKERTLTANEISEHCDIALSTTYRKLNQLVDAGIVEERIRLSLQNRQTREYSLRIETFNLNVTDEDGMLLTLRPD